jgi:hypothetical protein
MASRRRRREGGSLRGDLGGNPTCPVADGQNHGIVLAVRRDLDRSARGALLLVGWAMLVTLEGFT